MVRWWKDFTLHISTVIVTARNINQNKPVGVILDLDTLVGKMAQTSITMALGDFYTVHSNYSTRLVLHNRDSNNDDVQATVSALDLIQNVKTKLIIGPLKSSQAAIVSEVGNRSMVPVISFSATSPTLSSLELPYFVRSTISDDAQVSTITSIIKAYGWREVVPIYEDTDFGRDIIPFLADALQEIDVRIPYRSLIPISSTDDQIREELYKLQTMQTRIFVVHMSSSRGSTLFLKAKEVGMMSEGYAWIMTNGMTHMINSFDPSVIDAMRGALGVRLYVPKSKELLKFRTRWKRRLQEDYPNEECNEPSTYTLWAYDTIYALAMAVENVEIQNISTKKNSMVHELLDPFFSGPRLLEAITNLKFRGLSGNFEIIDGQLQYSAFEIINVVGYGIREIGYWKEKPGFSKQVDNSNNNSYSISSQNLNPVIWPGDSIVVPKGWEIPVTGKKLRVGVRLSDYPEFMNVEIDPVTNYTRASGYAVDVFEAVIKRLPYAVLFEYVLFGETSEFSSLSYDDFVYQVYLGNYDIVIGDITIRYNRTLYADFSLPYTESGVAMIVPVKKSENKSTFVFLHTLSLDLWLGSSIFLILTGITILILEPKIRKPHKSSIVGHLGAVMHLSLFAYQEKLENFLSKVVAIISVFVLLVLTSSYTANLSSILTIERLQPMVTDIHDLRGNYIGYPTGSFVKGLIEQLGFDKSKMKSVYRDFAKQLDKGSANGGVAAIVHEIPYIKFFLAKHCKSYMMVPIYKTAGFGFAFAKGSPLVPDFSQAILNITDGDDIINIEKKWIGDQNCQFDAMSLESNSQQLKFVSFWVLFSFSGVVCIISILIYAAISLFKRPSDTITMNLATDTGNITGAANHEGTETANPSVSEVHSGGNGNVAEEHNAIPRRIRARSFSF